MNATMQQFSPFCSDTWKFLSLISLGIDGKVAVTITASKRGITIRFGRIVAGRGKNVRAALRDFDRRAEQARLR